VGKTPKANSRICLTSKCQHLLIKIPAKANSYKAKCTKKQGLSAVPEYIIWLYKTGLDDLQLFIAGDEPNIVTITEILPKAPSALCDALMQS